MSKGTTLADTLRQAAIRDGRSMYILARDAGIPYPVLYYFLKGDRTGRKRRISIETADRLAKVLNLGLRPRKKGR